MCANRLSENRTSTFINPNLLILEFSTAMVAFTGLLPCLPFVIIEGLASRILVIYYLSKTNLDLEIFNIVQIWIF